MATKTKKKTAHDWGLIQDTPERLQEVLTDYRKKVSRTRGKRGYSDEQKVEHVKQLRQDTARRLFKVRQEAEDARTRLLQHYGSVMGRPAGDTNEQLLVQTKRARDWDRVKGLLDAQPTDPEAGDLVSVVREEARAAAARGDLQTILALREEVPTYFRIHRNRDLVPEVTGVITDALTMTFNDEQNAARLASDDLEDKWNRVSTSMTHAEEAAKHAVTDDYFIPGWEDGELLTIEGVPETTPEPNGDLIDLPSLSPQY